MVFSGGRQLRRWDKQAIGGSKGGGCSFRQKIYKIIFVGTPTSGVGTPLRKDLDPPLLEAIILPILSQKNTLKERNLTERRGHIPCATHWWFSAPSTHYEISRREKIPLTGSYILLILLNDSIESSQTFYLLL